MRKHALRDKSLYRRFDRADAARLAATISGGARYTAFSRTPADFARAARQNSGA